MTKSLNTDKPAGFVTINIDDEEIHGFGVTADDAWAMASKGIDVFFDKYENPYPLDAAREHLFKTVPVYRRL